MFPRSKAPPITMITCIFSIIALRVRGKERNSLYKRRTTIENSKTQSPATPQTPTAAQPLHPSTRSSSTSRYTAPHLENMPASTPRTSIARLSCLSQQPDHPSFFFSKQPRKEGNVHSNNQKTLKQQRQRRFPPCKTAIQQSYPGHDQPYDECAADNVDIVVFDTGVLQVHVDLRRIAAFGG